jgi:hypothetical protein
MEEPQLSDEEIMRQQEEKMKAKYGNLKPKKKLIHKDVKYFDSADYVLQHAQEDPEHPIDAQEDVGNLPTKISSSPPKKK